MTNKRLIWHLEKEKKIDDREFGFRKQRSTIDAIPKITNILNGLRRKEKTAAIFFDIEKAYDTVIKRKEDTKKQGNLEKNE